MQFLVLAYDGKDKDALKRRLAVRKEHIALSDKYVKEGKMIFGAALLDLGNDDRMIGSILVVDFPSRKELDEWLKIEPYVTGKVWQKIKIIPCKVGPSFVKKSRL